MRKSALYLFLIFTGILSSCSTSKETTQTSEKIYYTCPMHSEVFQTKPGHCPKCLMELVQWNPKQVPTNNYQDQHSGHSGHSGGGGCH
jgi:hypothetical protein